MPTIQRLLTDETGQSLVTAINNIVAAVKPNATEIQMGANDTTTVAEAINTQNQALSNLNNKMRIVSTGSLHDIRTAGVYWLTSGVTDKPEAGAGMYVVQLYGNDYISGTYTVADNNHQFAISLVGGTWKYEQFTMFNDIGGGAKISISSANATTYSFPIANRNKNLFMSFLVIRRDNLYPSMWILGVGTGDTPNVAKITVINSGGTALSDATVSNNTLNLTFNATAYGGVAVIQL